MAEGILGSIVATIIVAAATCLFRTYVRQQIEITYPRARETLAGAEPLGPGHSFPIRGKLKRLPPEHKIWLLIQHEVTGNVWPQSFFPVQYDARKGEWDGKINGAGRREVRIVAVVAPPTSQDFFQYFQKVGVQRHHDFEPLMRVPPECRNVASVQAFLP